MNQTGAGYTMHRLQQWNFRMMSCKVCVESRPAVSVASDSSVMIVCSVFVCSV